MIKVVPYDPNWVNLFESEKQNILKALGSKCLEIHHIGSTSVPGLAAKPKIDIIVVADNEEGIIPLMEAIGYQYKGEWNIPFKYGFTKRGNLDVNLHMFFDLNHPEIELNLKFRDYLRNHQKAKQDYADLKYSILQDETSHAKTGKLNIPTYTLRKRAFIDQIIAKTGYDRLRILKCITDHEWAQAEELSNQEIPQNARLSQNLEHFLLYKGIEIIAYSKIDLSQKEYKIFGGIDGYEKEYFSSTINKWLKNI